MRPVANSDSCVLLLEKVVMNGGSAIKNELGSTVNCLL